MTDAERLDFLQRCKLANFSQLNGNKSISSIGLFTEESQHVRGNTVREAIDNAITAAANANR